MFTSMIKWLATSLQSIRALRHDAHFKNVVLATVGAILMIEALHTSIGVHFEIGVSEINARSALGWWLLQIVSTAIWISGSTLFWWMICRTPYLKRCPVWGTGLLCFWVIWLFTDGHFLFDPNFTPLFGAMGATAPWIDIISMFVFRFFIPFIIWLAMVGKVLNPTWWRGLQSHFAEDETRKRLYQVIALGLVGTFITATRVPISTELVATKWQQASIEPSLIADDLTSDIDFDETNRSLPYTSDNDVFFLGEQGVSKMGRISNEVYIGLAKPLIDFLSLGQAQIYLIDVEKSLKSDIENSRVVEQISATELSSRFQKFQGWCSVQIDQSFAYRPEIFQSIKRYEQTANDNGRTIGKLLPPRHAGLFAAPLRNRIEGTGTGLSIVGATWNFVNGAKPMMPLDWPFETGDGSIVGFSPSQPIRIFIEKSQLELGFGPFCSEHLRKNTKGGLLYVEPKPELRVVAILKKSGHFDLPAKTMLHMPAKFWLTPIGASAGVFQSDTIDGYFVVNGESRELHSGTSVRVTNLAHMNSSSERARMHGRSSDMAFGGFMTSKRLIVFLSWEYWSAIAAFVLCYFGWHEHRRRSLDKRPE